MADEYINTTRPVGIPVLSTAEGRVEAVRDGTLLLGPNARPWMFPSAYADSLLLRVSQLARTPGVFGSHESNPQTLAYVEVVGMLGAYIRRLENVVELHAKCPR